AYPMPILPSGWPRRKCSGPVLHSGCRDGGSGDTFGAPPEPPRKFPQDHTTSKRTAIACPLHERNNVAEVVTLSVRLQSLRTSSRKTIQPREERLSPVLYTRKVPA